MRSSPFCLLVILAATSMLVASSAVAQNQTSKAPPPDLQKLDEGAAADVTIRPTPPRNKITQKRVQGVVTDVEVHSGGSHYFVKQSAGPNNAAPGEGMINSVRPATWQIKEFDWGGKPKVDKASDAAADAPPPPSKK